jgi:hypothetical protein
LICVPTGTVISNGLYGLAQRGGKLLSIDRQGMGAALRLEEFCGRSAD